MISESSGCAEAPAPERKVGGGRAAAQDAAPRPEAQMAGEPDTAGAERPRSAQTQAAGEPGAPVAEKSGGVRPAGARGPGEGVPAVPAARVVLALAAALAVVLACALAVMLAISAFDHSYADDWHYGVDAHLALEAGGGVLGAVAAAGREVVDTYFSWQGTYSAIFLMALQPGVFGEQLYGLGAAAIIAALAAATAYAAGVAVRDVLRAPRSVWAVVTCLVLLLQTQLLPSPVEGFWWYNSAIYYTFYHALMLAGAGLAVRVARGRGARGPFTRRGLAVRAALFAALALVVAGGNFVTGVVAGLALFCAAIGCIARGNRRGLLLVPALLVFAAGFALSMAAPGNAVRQATQFPGDNLGVLMTLVRSGLAGFEYLVLWTNGFFVLALALAVPVMAWAARRSPCSFARPWAPALASMLLFMASFAPTFYSMGNVGPGRVQNIRYDLFVVLAFVCAGWFCGWCVRRMERAGRAAPALCGRVRRRAARAWPAYAAVWLAVLVLAVCALAVDERHRDDVVSISAAASLASDEAQAYDEQVWARIGTLTESPAQDLRLPYYTVAPKVLFMGDIQDSMDSYINFRLAQWYGRDSVIGYAPAG